MIETIIFTAGSIFIVWYSIPSLRRPGSHGFYRFFAWEAILGLFLLNVRGWLDDPFAWHQIISWILLIVSIFPVVQGVTLLRKAGKPEGNFEATTQLVTRGIYHYIRHPLYASLLYLAWGIFFKSPSLLDGCLAAVATAFLYATARADESECLIKFGEEYAGYMKTTKMFIPFLF
ncbi:MAG: isoprenylcysteine carboxylmethyltransferase family protein [Chloroflexi bacterium]|nr:isoprenylcysteine carboxylmethyltransferase family protein [Chloroflexota bacterium]